MKRIAVVLGILLSDCLAAVVLHAQHLPAILPVQPNSSHQQEDFSGLRRKTGVVSGDPWDLHGMNLSNADLTRSDLLFNTDVSDANLSGANLTHANLKNADLTNADLTGAVVTGTSFSRTTLFGFTLSQLYSTASYLANDLQGIDLSENSLAGADFSGQNLTGAGLSSSSLASADFASAVVNWANFGNTTSFGFTAEQLYSTASYEKKDLRGMGLSSNDLSGWDLSDQNVEGVDFSDTNLTQQQLYATSSYQAKNLQGVGLGGETKFKDLTGWDFTGQNVRDTRFQNSNLTKEQLYSTSSYQAKNLGAIWLPNKDWDLSGQNLAGATLTSTSAILAGAIISESFSRDSLTKQQLYSTASYQAKDLHGIYLGSNNQGGAPFRGWDLSGQNLSSSYLFPMRDVNLSGANLTGAGIGIVSAGTNLSGAVIKDAFFYGDGSASSQISSLQFYSTASYQSKDLQGIYLQDLNLADWDLSGQDLSNASLTSSKLAKAKLAGAIVKGTDFSDTTSRGFIREQLYSTASYQAKDLQGIDLSRNNLAGWDLSGQALTNANLWSTDLTNTNLSDADLRWTIWSGPGAAVLGNTILPDGTLAGLNVPDGQSLLIRDQNPYQPKPCVTPLWSGCPPMPNAQAPLPIQITEGFTLGTGSRLELRMTDANWSSTLVVHPDAPVNISGAELSITFVMPPTDIAQGSALTLFDWSTSPGPANHFARFSAPAGTAWDISKIYTTGQVTLLGISSDINADQDVDSDDLLDFLANWTGSEYALHDKTWQNGDSDKDGDVDSADMIVFLSHWTGAKAATFTGSVTVPEPSTALTPFLLAISAVIRNRGRRRRRDASFVVQAFHLYRCGSPIAATTQGSIACGEAVSTAFV